VKTVLVVGAGPAGMFAARKIALAGYQVIVLNRDIKPGGLAEYGIYPVKDKMKFGLRKQFANVLAMPNVHYLGHVPVGTKYAVTIDELRQFKPAAMVFAVGAQGTKKLGLPGEAATGVYSAKDFVYFYNQLPPFASQDFSTGKRVAIVGMGNVMVDIARWLMEDGPRQTTEEVVVVARRGPLEAKFDEKEFAHIERHLDRKDFDQELERIKDKLTAIGQDPAKIADETFPILKKPSQEPTPPILKFRFLCSPKEIHVGPKGRICGLTLTENILVARNGSTSAKTTDQTARIDVDTMIFAIGDVHDVTLGLPCSPDGYTTRPNGNDPKAPVYEVFDPQAGQVLPGVYVVGWARRASEGLVGIARHDAEVGADHVIEYLKTAAETPAASPDEIQRYLEQKGMKVVNKTDLGLLGKAEEREAKERGLNYFKYSDDGAMLAAIEQEKSKTEAAVTP
jgi:ferredoxin--NADP+ reductase